MQIPGFWEREDVENVVRGLDDVLVNDENPEIRWVVWSIFTSFVVFYCPYQMNDSKALS